MNYLHSEPVKTEFVIANVNIYEMQKQTCEHVNLNTRAKKMGHKYEVLTIWMILG